MLRNVSPHDHSLCTYHTARTESSRSFLRPCMRARGFCEKHPRDHRGWSSMRLVATLCTTSREQDPCNSRDLPATLRSNEETVSVRVNVLIDSKIKKIMSAEIFARIFVRALATDHTDPSSPRHHTIIYTRRSSLCVFPFIPYTLYSNDPRLVAVISQSLTRILICLSRRTFLLNRIPGTPGTAVPSRKTRPGRTTR